MSITDELREWMRVVLTDDDPAHAIADRIDAEHEAKVSYWQGACYEDGYKEGLADNEGAMAERGWVKLPVDADGVPIRVGDVMWQKDRITKRACKAIMGDTYVMLDGIQGAVYAKGLTHYHAPTVEDVLRECCYKYHSLLIDDMNDAINRVERDYIAPDEIIAEYAAKLKLGMRSDHE